MNKLCRIKQAKLGRLGIPVEKLDQTLPVKVGSRMRKRIEKAAEREGKAVSEWMRDAAYLVLNISEGGSRD